MISSPKPRGGDLYFQKLYPQGAPDYSSQIQATGQGGATVGGGAGVVGGGVPIATSIMMKKLLMGGPTAGQTIAPSLGGGMGGVGAAGAGVQGAGIAAPQMMMPGAESAIGGGVAPVLPSVTPEPTTISNFAGSATPYLGAAGTAFGAYNAYKGIKAGNPLQAGLGGAGAGLGLNAMGYALGPWGWGAAVALPAVAAMTGGKKSKVQLARDTARSALQGGGIADKSFMVNGFDIGKDGHAMLKNVGSNIDGKGERHYYDVDFSNPLAKNNLGRVIPLVSKFLGQDASEKLRSDTAGMLMNALTHNAKTQDDFEKNFSTVFKGAGIALPKAKAASTRSKTRSPGIAKDGGRLKY